MRMSELLHICAAPGIGLSRASSHLENVLSFIFIFLLAFNYMNLFVWDVNGFGRNLKLPDV